MPSSESLCGICKNINFEALRTPSAADVEDIVAGRITGERSADMESRAGQDKVTLGPLSRIRKDSLTCPLCFLFLQAIESQGAVYAPHSAYETLDTHEIFFRADPDLSYYARIFGVDNTRTGCYVLRRLNLTGHLVSSPDYALAYFDNVLQVCSVGTLTDNDDDIAMEAQRIEAIMPFGGRKRLPILDLRLVHRWVSICTSEHGRHCSLDSTPSQIESTRLIDVRQKSVVELHHPKLAELEFMALSYVWGSTQTARLLKANCISLQRFGSLHEQHLPRTIADSIDLVAQLGYQYLWVDALCIIQDDPNDQSYQISKMATIYSSALLTILAAFGEDSDAGLPGLGSSTRLSKQQEVVVIPPSENNDGLSVLNTLKSHPKRWDESYTRSQEDGDFSKWSQRAWTMQEKALSRRALMFTKEQVFWSCQLAYFCEETCFEVPGTMVRQYYPSVHRLRIQQGRSDPWELYSDLIKNYMQRDLTYKGDIFHAFQAIIDAMEKVTETEFLWGMPRSRFELALLWQSFHDVRRRRDPSTLPMTSLKKQITFPSWSWLGWLGDIQCIVGDHRRESENAIVVCFVHQSHPLRLNHVTPRVESLTTSDLWTDKDIQQYDLSPRHLTQHLPNLSGEVLSRFPDEHILFFWTRTAFFSVIHDQSNKIDTPLNHRNSQYTPRIQDRNGKTIGSLCKTNTAYTGQSDHPKEFIAVGRRQITGVPEELAEEICPPAILALQVERDELDLCSRINIAEISLRAWMQAEPKEVLIALQ